MKTVKPVLFKRKTTEKRGTIKIRITDTLTKKSSYVNLGYIIPEKLWNYNTNRVRKSDEVDSEKINNEIVEKLELLGISNNNIKAVRSNNASFVEFCNRFIKRRINHGTRIKYVTVMNKLEKYLIARGKEDILFGELNAEIVADIRRYFHENKLSNNTQNSYLKIIKSFVNKAIEEDEFTYFKHPFASEKFTKEIKVPDSLSQKELEKIINTPILSDNYLYKYKLTFLFQFFAQGMRISDVQQLRFNMLKQGYIVYKMRKTASPMSVQLNKNLYEILKVVVRKYHIKEGDPTFAQLFSFENQLHSLIEKFKGRILAVYRINYGQHFFLDSSMPLDMIEPATAKIPVLLFCRVSSGTQDFGYQIEELQQYCDANNHKIVETIANNISGRTGNKRPDLDHLFSLAKKGGFRKVIVTSVERLGRDAKMIRRTIDFLHERRISVVFKNQNFESLDVNGEETFVTNILISVYAEVSMEDNKQRSAKIKSGIANAVKKGKVVGRPAGWKKDDGTLLREHAKLVKDLKQGLSLNQCVKLHGVAKNTVIKVKRAISNKSEYI